MQGGDSLRRKGFEFAEAKYLTIWVCQLMGNFWNESEGLWKTVAVYFTHVKYLSQTEQAKDQSLLLQGPVGSRFKEKNYKVFQM